MLNTFKPLRTIAVLGAGVMGSQIAAHLANAGLSVHLLDLAAPEGKKNQWVEAAFEKARKQTPPILFAEKIARRVHLGNFDEHFGRLAQVDWVIEAVVENLAIKQQLLERLEGAIRDDAIISTNTSGLPIGAIAQGRSDSFRRRFLGTHFFNPPRYLKLLEIIPTPQTDPQILKRLQWFGRLHLGKGVVIAKDTPSFIANRIGMYLTMLTFQIWLEGGYTLEEIDALTGELVGRPKSATFRTADLVGLDTLVSVADHLYPAIPQDESREVLHMPEVLRQLVKSGALGAKTGRGFYKKDKKQILSLNPETLDYEPAKPLNLDNIESFSRIADWGDRLRTLYRDRGRAGTFFRDLTVQLLGYCARRLPEIANSPADIDRALRWGFGWELGPFEMWDIFGFSTIIADLQAVGSPIPDWIATLQAEGATGFYQSEMDMGEAEPELCRGEACLTSGLVRSPQGAILLGTPTDEIHLGTLKADASRTLWHNEEAALLDLGEGVVLYEFRSKGNTLSFKVIAGLSRALDLLEQEDFQGLVIGNDSPNFSAGANLAEMGNMAQSGNWEGLAALLGQFQALMQRLHYFPKPIVAAVQGRALGGGCELVMACPHVVAAAESYLGLVEVSVGLIPGGGGLLRLVTQAGDRAASEAPAHLQPFLRQAFETVAMAKVSNSAYEAQELGLLSPHALIVMNGDRRLFVAKEEVLRLSREGYLPPPERPAIPVLGGPGKAMLDHAAYLFQSGGFASEYDRYLASQVAHVMAGGNLSAPALVPEAYLLQLERETFVPLLQQPKTQERIAHLLKTKKPLRN
jgi:3-hydroxyacyl-CoA dehydrogenase